MIDELSPQETVFLLAALEQTDGEIYGLDAVDQYDARIHSG